MQSDVNAIKRLFVSSDLETTLSCPGCGKAKRLDVSELMRRDSQVKFKCRCKRCGHHFSVVLERRRSVRKNTRLPGILMQNRQKEKIQINNLSRHGLQVRLAQSIPAGIGEMINIQFQIDDPPRSMVTRNVRVKNRVSPTQVGCEFLSNEHYGNLGKYFLFYF